MKEGSKDTPPGCSKMSKQKPPRATSSALVPGATNTWRMKTFMGLINLIEDPSNPGKPADTHMDENNCA